MDAMDPQPPQKIECPAYVHPPPSRPMWLTSPHALLPRHPPAPTFPPSPTIPPNIPPPPPTPPHHPPPPHPPPPPPSPPIPPPSKKRNPHLGLKMSFCSFRLRTQPPSGSAKDRPGPSRTHSLVLMSTSALQRTPKKEGTRFEAWTLLSVLGHFWGLDHFEWGQKKGKRSGAPPKKKEEGRRVPLNN